MPERKFPDPKEGLLAEPKDIGSYYQGRALPQRFAGGTPVPSIWERAGPYGRELLRRNLEALSYANERIMSPLTALAEAPGLYGEEAGRRVGGESAALLGKQAGEAISWAEPGKVGPLLAPILLPKGPLSTWWHAGPWPLSQFKNIPAGNVTHKYTYLADTPQRASEAAVAGSDVLHRARLTRPINVFELGKATPEELAELQALGIKIDTNIGSPAGGTYGTNRFGLNIRWTSAEAPSFQKWLRQHNYDATFVKDEAERSLAVRPEHVTKFLSIVGQAPASFLRPAKPKKPPKSILTPDMWIGNPPPEALPMEKIINVRSLIKGVVELADLNLEVKEWPSTMRQIFKSFISESVRGVPHLVRDRGPSLSFQRILQDFKAYHNLDTHVPYKDPLNTEAQKALEIEKWGMTADESKTLTETMLKDELNTMKKPKKPKNPIYPLLEW